MPGHDVGGQVEIEELRMLRPAHRKGVPHITQERMEKILIACYPYDGRPTDLTENKRN